MTWWQLDEPDEPNRPCSGSQRPIGLWSIMIMSSTPEKDHRASSTVTSVLLADAPQ